MKVIGATQGAFVDVYLGLLDALRISGQKIEMAAGYVSFARHFKASNVVRNYEGDIIWLKEWEIFQAAASHQTDYQRLKKYEQLFGPGRLWDAIICDRRLVHGRSAKFKEDYQTPHQSDFLDALLDLTITRIEDFFERVQPNLVLGFVPVTFGESLILDFAKYKKIPTLVLRTVKISNFNAFHDRFPLISNHFVEILSENRQSEEALEVARKYFEQYKKSGLQYEGIGDASNKPALFNPARALKNLPSVLFQTLKVYFDEDLKNDNHDFGVFNHWFQTEFHKPYTAWKNNAFLKRSGRLLKVDDLKTHGSEWAFYPAHCEPEIALQIFGRPYHKDQIEVLRSLGASLPVGMKLLVKEHPRSVGYRPNRYYKKLLEIPNLYFVDVDTPSPRIVSHVDLVAVISGVIGMEAACVGKPVVVLGHAEFEILSNQMVRSCHDLYELPKTIMSLMETYKKDEEEIIRFMAAIITGSVGVDVYSVLLNKSNRYHEKRGEHSMKDKRNADLNKLAEYTLKRWQEEKERLENDGT